MTPSDEIHTQLLRITKARTGLDAEEARYIVAAERAQIHLGFGCVTVVEYLERFHGYRRKDAVERVRVAQKLELLPDLMRALESGTLKWSAVRELTRIVKPHTEDEWIEEALGKSVHQIEAMVAGRKPGDRPPDERHPEL